MWGEQGFTNHQRKTHNSPAIKQNESELELKDNMVLNNILVLLKTITYNGNLIVLFATIPNNFSLRLNALDDRVWAGITRKHITTCALDAAHSLPQIQGIVVRTVILTYMNKEISSNY